MPHLVDPVQLARQWTHFQSLTHKKIIEAGKAQPLIKGLNQHLIGGILLTLNAFLKLRVYMAAL